MQTYLLIPLVAFLLASCSSHSDEILQVRQFHLKKENPSKKRAYMIRGEQMHRLRGAVTLKERRARLGQYYTVTWKNPHPNQGQLKLVMDYQQTATGARVLQMSRRLPAGVSQGKVEFKVVGEPYRVGGRVLAWRIRLMQGRKMIAEKHSYLWK